MMATHVYANVMFCRVTKRIQIIFSVDTTTFLSSVSCHLKSDIFEIQGHNYNEIDTTD